MQTIGERLAYVRKNILSMSQKEFAQLIKVSQGSLSNSESNARGISMEAIIELIKYSKLTGTFSCEWILTGIENETKELAPDESELLKNYNELDRRGQHRVHTVTYEELDRITDEKNTVRSVG